MLSEESEKDMLDFHKDLVNENDREEPDWRVRFAPGTYGCHELLDRTSIIANLVSDLGDHPACVANVSWYAKAWQAQELLNELYQMVGESHLGDQDKGPPPYKPADPDSF